MSSKPISPKMGWIGSILDEWSVSLRRWLISRGPLFLFLVVVLFCGAYSHRSFFIHCLIRAGHLITSENLPKTLSALAWPFAVFISVVLLRRALLSLLNRVENLIWGDKSVKFSRMGAEYSKSETSRAPKPEEITDADATQQALALELPEGTTQAVAATAKLDGTKVASIFWAGCDLTYVYDILLRGGDRGTIAHVFRQANHHMKGTGLKGTSIQLRLQRLTDDAAKSLERDWTSERRIEFAREAYGIARDLGEMTIPLQPGFSGDPTTSD